MPEPIADSGAPDNHFYSKTGLWECQGRVGGRFGYRGLDSCIAIVLSCGESEEIKRIWPFAFGSFSIQPGPLAIAHS